MACNKRPRKRRARRTSKAKKQTQNKFKTADTAADSSCPIEKPVTQFSKFPLLPAELRAIVWLFAILRPKIVKPWRHLRIYDGNYVCLSKIAGLPRLVVACKEVYHIAVKAFERETHAGGIDSHRDIMYFAVDVYKGLQDRFVIFYGNPSPSIPYRPQLQLSDMRRIAVEYDLKSWRPTAQDLLARLFLSERVTHLFLVINCQRPNQEILDSAWEVAADCHSRCSSRPPIGGLERTPLEITILLKRRKHNIRRNGVFTEFDEFLTKFTVVPFKPGYQARTGRHGILRSFEPIPPPDEI